MAVVPRLVGGGLILLGVAAAGAGAAESELGEARRLLAAGQAAQVVALLEGRLLQLAGDTEYDYLLGLAYHRAGQAGPAQFAFERVLMMAPNHVEARLLLAQIDVDRGGVRYARELLEPLAGQQLDAGQQAQLARIRASLTAAASKAPLAVRGYVLAGIGWDDNVTSGPNHATLMIPGLSTTTPTALGSAARASDRVNVLEVGTTLSKTLGEDTWLTVGGTARWGDNGKRDDVQEGFYNLDIGLLRRSGNEYFGVALAGQNYRVGNLTYRNSQGARLYWAHPVDQSLRLISYVNYINFDFTEHTIDNAARSVIGVTAESTQAGGERNLRFGVYGGHERAKDPSKPHFSYDLLGLQLGASQRLSNDLALAAGAIGEWQNHAVEDPLSLVIRHDRLLSLGLSADYRLSQRWHLLPQYSYSRNASKAALNAYERNAWMVHFRWDFDHD